MALCKTCKTIVLWGGIKKDGRRYCNSSCMEQDIIGRFADQIPDSVVRAEAKKIMKGRCPECNQISNDIEMRFSYRAVSYLVMTTWSKNPILSCSNCHRKKIAGDTTTTLFLGWWGFPFGLIVTPMQLFRNISAASSSHSPAIEPSSELCSFVRSIIAQTEIEKSSLQISQNNGSANTKKKDTLRKSTPPPIPSRVAGPKSKPIVPR